MAAIESGDRWAAYVATIAERNQAMLVIAGVVLVTMAWWGLLHDRPRLRRAVGWGLVVLYCVTMLLMVLVSGGTNA